MTSIAVIDHGAGNLVSIGRGLERSGAAVTVVTTPEGLADVDGVVLPGVGNAAAAFDRIEASGFVEPLQRLEAPLLGICVGFQLLFDGSDEDDSGGLGLLPGRVRRLTAPRLPHIGWNDLAIVRPDPLLDGIGGEPLYFVHSYAPEPSEPGDVVATTDYPTAFAAVARRGHVAGVQFHPERSGNAGLRVLENFVTSCGTSRRAA